MKCSLSKCPELGEGVALEAVLLVVGVAVVLVAAVGREAAELLRVVLPIRQEVAPLA
jgi:hypothetical protein